LTNFPLAQVNRQVVVPGGPDEGAVLGSGNRRKPVHNGRRPSTRRCCLGRGKRVHELSRGGSKESRPRIQGRRREVRGNTTAESTLVAELRDGKGHPKVAASDAELQSMVAYVLATGK